MIEVAPNTAITIYLAIFLTVIMGLWLYTHLTKRHKKIIMTEQHLLICEYCQCAYVEDHTKEVTKCPDCQSFNKNNLYKK
jgi:predicted Zn-ribbon and HTH transcriptional regulator